MKPIGGITLEESVKALQDVFVGHDLVEKKGEPMDKRLFWDNFDEYYAVPTKEDLMLAPPERYIPVFDAGNLYVEKWTVSGSYRGDRLTIAFPREMYYDDRRFVCITRKSMEERNNCTLRQIYGFGIPSDEYKKYSEELGAEMEENDETD